MLEQDARILDLVESVCSTWAAAAVVMTEVTAKAVQLIGRPQTQPLTIDLRSGE
jgi:hypothetical protein